MSMNLGPMDIKSWGPAGWGFMHAVSFAYPDDPTDEDKENAIAFFSSIPFVLPCKRCKDHFKEAARRNPVANHVGDMDSLSRWVVDLHNEVNSSINRPTRTYDETYMEYMGPLVAAGMAPMSPSVRPPPAPASPYGGAAAPFAPYGYSSPGPQVRYISRSPSAPLQTTQPVPQPTQQPQATAQDANSNTKAEQPQEQTPLPTTTTNNTNTNSNTNTNTNNTNVNTNVNNNTNGNNINNNNNNVNNGPVIVGGGGGFGGGVVSTAPVAGGGVGAPVAAAPVSSAPVLSGGSYYPGATTYYPGGGSLGVASSGYGSFGPVSPSQHYAANPTNPANPVMSYGRSSLSSASPRPWNGGGGGLRTGSVSYGGGASTRYVPNYGQAYNSFYQPSY